MSALPHALALLLLLVLPRETHAATITGTPASDAILVGETVTIDVDLVLDAAEVASVLELKLDLDGLDSVVKLDDVSTDFVFCQSWSGLKDGSVVDSNATVSCTSENEGGTRLSASLSVTGLGLGLFRILLGPGSFAQQDTETFPFIEDLPLDPSPGTVISSVAVVPEPGAGAMTGLGLAALAMLRRRVASER
jgi:hypothetical protein